MMNIKNKGYHVGDKIKFRGERNRYTVKAKSKTGRYMICTKPFNAVRHVVYTIVDFKDKIRGTNNMVFNPYDYMVQEDIDMCMADLESGEVEISYRNRVPLEVIE